MQSFTSWYPAPRAAYDPVDGEDVGQDAAERVERGVEWTAGRNQCRPIAVADRVLVEVGQQMGDGRGPAQSGRRGLVPVVLVLDDPMPERRARELDAHARLGRGQTGPPSEVLDLRRSVAAEVPARQLRKRLTALELACLGSALFE